MELTRFKSLRPYVSTRRLDSRPNNSAPRLHYSRVEGTKRNVLTGLKDSYAFVVAGILDVCNHRTPFIERPSVPVAFRDGHDQPGGLQPPRLRGSKLGFLTL